MEKKMCVGRKREERDERDSVKTKRKGVIYSGRRVREEMRVKG